MALKPLAAAALGFGVAAALGNPLIELLRSRALRQRAYEDAPQSHQVKTGTPTMGGVLFLAGPLAGIVFARDRATVPLLLLIAGSAAIGFADDISKIRGGKNRGLRGRPKFALTALAGITFLALLARSHGLPHALFPFSVPGPALVRYPLALAAIVATTHAVNLTDGLDGLAGGTVLPPLAVLIAVALRAGESGTATILGGIGGAVGGFLLYNRHPARMFMGDTGSLALGAALAGGAIVTGTPLLLPLVGGIFAAEALSVIVQVASYKTTKRRVFRMSPLHHHFELGGWPETKVTTRFWTASAILGLGGYAWVRARG